MKKTELKELKSRILFFVRRLRTLLKSKTQSELQPRELEIGQKPLRVKLRGWKIGGRWNGKRGKNIQGPMMLENETCLPGETEENVEKLTCNNQSPSREAISELSYKKRDCWTLCQGCKSKGSTAVFFRCATWRRCQLLTLHSGTYARNQICVWWIFTGCDTTTDFRYLRAMSTRASA